MRTSRLASSDPVALEHAYSGQLFCRASANSLFGNEGGLRSRFLPLLFKLTEAMEHRGRVLELTSFSQERRPNLPLPALAEAAAALTGPGQHVPPRHGAGGLRGPLDSTLVAFLTQTSVRFTAPC